MKHLLPLLVLVLVLPIQASDSFFHLIAYGRGGGESRTNILLTSGERIRVDSVTFSPLSAGPSFTYRLRCLYFEAGNEVLLSAGSYASGPCRIELANNADQGQIVVAECTFQTQETPVHIAAGITVSRSTDLSNWSPVAVFDDTSTNAFYRFKIDVKSP